MDGGKLRHLTIQPLSKAGSKHLDKLALGHPSLFLTPL